jgi:MFS family permease
MMGSISFLVAETIGVIIIGMLADQYGRKLMLLMCLYIPVVCKTRFLFLQLLTHFLSCSDRCRHSPLPIPYLLSFVGL